jgi:hypothetical protein
MVEGQCIRGRELVHPRARRSVVTCAGGCRLIPSSRDRSRFSLSAWPPGPRARRGLLRLAADGPVRQQSAEARSASQKSCWRFAGREPSRDVSRPRHLTVRRLSNDAAQSTWRPSAIPSGSSDGMPRTVREMGATTMLVSTSTASLLVTTSTGRRLSSASAHHTSPRAGTITTVPR